MRLIHGLMLLVVPLALASGCTTLPDVKPFADSTAALAAAAGTQYHDLSNDIATLNIEKSDIESDADFQARTKDVKDKQATVAATGKSLDALFNAMTTYSEKLASLAAAGKTGPDAAQSLLDSAKGFEDLAGIAAPAVSSAAEAITKVFKAFADEVTKRQAKKSLLLAADAAQPAVDEVAKQFGTIYADALADANDYVRNTEKRQARRAAGTSVIGFNDKVVENYNAYYGYLNGLVPDATTDSDKNKATALWRGFCTEKQTPCKATAELEAVSLVEARMAAIHPIVEAYQARVTDIEATYTRRRKANGAVVKAVQAWALEHQKLRSSLQDGTPLSAFNLRAALVELEGLLGQKP